MARLKAGYVLRAALEIRVVLNWYEEVKRMVPRP